MDMQKHDSLLRNRSEHGPEPHQGAARPAWAITALASVLIFTTVVDVLGNLLVIVSVLRNRKLRNAGKELKTIVIQSAADSSARVCTQVCKQGETKRSTDQGAGVIIQVGSAEK